MKIVKKILIVLLIAFVAIQFYRPEKNNEPLRGISAFEFETKPNETISALLNNKCYDCHSNLSLIHI